MYFVDREKIENILGYVEQQLSLFEEKKEWETAIEKAALERVCHTVIEGILDVGNAMIDGFIMRDPGSYEDIIDILEDEKVITFEMSQGLKGVLLYRKMLVQNYTEIEHEDLQHAFHQQLETLKKFSPNVQQYLLNELGPVSAFRN
ncbi:DUF86 domain-containing protein [Robertmurraya massiliosenegalensis]|uniref:DUF86 domain-containing protein n=1 Tax=Robertmurraya massiliosenegalensis TaxID=1287657 RepID=UPI00036F2689|nr:DUF86 domain-containing protein [Robertmurraya massiliosenegalensis]